MSVEPFSTRALWISEPELIAELDDEGDLYPAGFRDDQTLPATASIASVTIDVAPDDTIDLAATRVISVDVTHSGEGSPWVTAWSDKPVRVATRLWNDSTNTVVAETRAEIYETVTPGDSFRIDVPLPSDALLNENDDFTVEIGVVQERVSWLSPPTGETNPRRRVARS